MKAAGDRVKLIADRARSSDVRWIEVITRTDKRRGKGSISTN